MAFTVEDGTGVAGANSYTTTAFADAYFADRDNAVWAAALAGDKEGWLILATDYIDQVFSQRFLGEMAEPSQRLAWPRIDVEGYADNTIPERLQMAASEYALRAISGPLMPDPLVDATGLTVVTTRKAVGPIEKEFRPYGSTQPRLVRAYPAADSLLRPLLRTGSGNRVTR